MTTISGGPAWAATACTGTIHGATIADDVNVPPGAGCVLWETTVTGNVTVGAGASITLVGATVQGSFTSSGAHDVRMGNCLEFGCGASRATVVHGNVLIEGTTGVPGFPTKNVVCDASLMGGNVVLRNNRAPFAIGADPQCFYGGGIRVGGSLVLTSNTAAMTLTGNAISYALQCFGNSPAPTNGGGNTAPQKVGQCAAF